MLCQGQTCSLPVTTPDRAPGAYERAARERVELISRSTRKAPRDP